MSKITIVPADGIYPRLNNYDIPVQPGQGDLGPIIKSAAVTANNCDFQTSRLSPLKALGSSVSSAGDVSIYLNGASWLSWSTDVDVVKEPVESSTRLIYSGDGAPKILDVASEYTLGLPAPTAAATQATQAKTAAAFTLTWHYYYEEPTGVWSDPDAGAIAPAETTPGVTYTLASIPAKIAASADARFIMWAELYDGVTYLGKIIPDPARDAPQTDAESEGSTLTGGLTTGATAVLTITYDTSRASQYTQERSYYYCFVRIWADGKIDLGPPGVVSAVLSVDPTEDVQLSAMEVGPTGYNITHKWIYRLAIGVSGEDYQFVAQVTDATTSYLDILPDSDLDEVDPEYVYSAPPTDLTSLRSHPAGFILGISPSLKSVCCSVLRETHAFPALTHRIPLKDIPISLDVVGQTIIVTTDADPVYLYGEDPANLSKPDKVPIEQANVSKRGTVNTGSTVIFPSNDGMISVGLGTADIMTKSYYTREQWLALGPASMISAYHDQTLYVFHSTGCLIFRDGKLTTTTDVIQSAHVDGSTDALYISVGGVIYPWEGITNRTAQWRSGYARYASLYTWGAARVDAADYPVTLKLYRKNKASIGYVVTSNKPFTLPRGSSAREWLGYEVISAYDVFQIELAQTREELGS